MTVCGIPTVRGPACTQATREPFGCCPNHVGHWCVDDRARLLAVFTHFAGRIARVTPWCGDTCGLPRIREFPEIEVGLGRVTAIGTTSVRMGLDDACVIADLLADLGSRGAAELILVSVDLAREEWPERSKRLGGCDVFGCGRDEAELRTGRCANHPL